MTEPSSEPRDVAANYVASMTADEFAAFMAEARSTGETGMAAGRNLYRKLDAGPKGNAAGLDAGRDLYRGGKR